MQEKGRDQGREENHDEEWQASNQGFMPKLRYWRIQNRKIKAHLTLGLR
jgi:hypothetical protein